MLPSLSDTMGAVKSGSIFKDYSGTLTEISSSAGQLPDTIKAQFTGTVVTVEQAIKNAQGTMSNAASIAGTYAEVLNKKAQAAGTTPDPSAACGPLAIFSQIKEFLADMKSKIGELISNITAPLNELKSKFGAAFDELQTKIKAVTSAVTEAAKKLAEEALELYKQANKALSDAFSAINDKVSELTGKLTKGFNDLVDAGKTALKNAIAEIKEFAASIKFSLPFNSPCLADAKEAALDVSKLAPNISLPSLDSVTKQAEGMLSSATAQLESAVASGSALAVQAAKDAVASAKQGIEQAKSMAESAAAIGSKNLSTVMQQAPLPSAKPSAAAVADSGSTPSVDSLLDKKEETKQNWYDALEARAKAASENNKSEYQAQVNNVKAAFAEYEAANAAAKAKLS